MYCSDCHGSNTANGTVVPNGGTNGSPWGPHGSSNVFILKGPWSNSTGAGRQGDLCFKCHDYTNYANSGNSNPANSGFALDPNSGGGMTGGGMMGGMMGGGTGGGGMMMCMMMGGMCMGNMAGGMMGDGMVDMNNGTSVNNLHIFHANVVNNFRCNLCHVAVPHGWKNKNFLVNLNDVGQEAGYSSPRQMRNNTTAGYIQGPYYNKAVLKLVQFGASGLWDPGFCGSAGSPGNGITGVNWMAGNSEACVNVP